MSSFEIENFKESAEMFMCANTPSYLYKHLKKLQEVESFAHKMSTKGLYKLCKQTSEASKKNHESELRFYICLIALSFKAYPESSTYLKLLETNEYKWANSIISLILEEYVPVTMRKIHIKNKPKMVFPEVKSIESTASATKFDLTDNGAKKYD